MSFAIICSVLVLLNISRFQEIVPGLGALHLDLVMAPVAMGLALLSRRLNGSNLAGLKESKLVLALLLAAALSIPFSVWPGGAIHYFLHAIIPAAIFYFCCVSLSGERELNLLSWSAVVSMGVLVAGAMVFSMYDAENRLHTTNAYDPNDLAMIMVSILPLALAHLINGRVFAKIFASCVIFSGLVVLVRTGSRGGFIAFLAVLLIMLFRRSEWFGKKKKLLLVASLAAIILFQNTGILRQRFDTLFNGQDYNLAGSDQDGRLVVWKRGLSIMLGHPFLGEGVGLIGTAMGDRYGHAAWHTAHNSFLQIGGELGIPGLLIYIFMLVFIRRNCRYAAAVLRCSEDSRRLAAIAEFAGLSLSGYLVGGFFISQAYSPVPIFLLALSTGLARVAREKAAAGPVAPEAFDLGTIDAGYEIPGGAKVAGREME